MAGDQEGMGFVHRQDVLTLLNRDLANEMNLMLMFMADGLLAKGEDSLDVKEVADKFAKKDFKHVKKLSARIVELNGTPQLMPTQIINNASIDAKAPSQRGEVQSILKDLLENELQSVLELKSQVQNIGFEDPTTRSLLEDILADKEHQVEEIRDLLGI